ncbi:hypothetical protein RHGRI_031507 [Rhododendron griersonianum]|uniref:S-protein homolog n=2 Tax=Rhododendron griersonianum TaxID=479676 RepID=A0AAV6I878_9ERIC|nr:hypothetical protein RHGRI_031507 [Rhododendron griersonianum]
MGRFLLPLLIMTFCFGHAKELAFQNAKICLGCYKVTVHIINAIPDQATSLTFRCQSKDDDLGNHTTKYREEFYWRFVPNAWGSTLFFCHFYWGSKQRVFAVYDRKIEDFCGRWELYHHNCYYEVRPDGFYRSFNLQLWYKFNDWI